ncbi:MAG: DUF2207 domain-containing protein, partial [Anaerolineae bacterium]
MKRLAIVACVLAFVVFAPRADAQVRTLNWQRWDVTIDINTDGSLDVREEYELEFVGGDFTFGTAEIEINQLDAIEDVRVSDTNRAYQQTASEEPFTYEVERGGGQYTITWYYPPSRDMARTFILEYRVIGAVIIDDSRLFGDQEVEPGDRLRWTAIRDHAVPIASSAIVVTTPPGAAIDTTIVPPLVDGVSSATVDVTDNRLAVSLGRIPTGQSIGVALRWEHGAITGEPPSWQESFIRERAASARLAAIQPVLNLLFIVLGAGAAFAGVVGAYSLWFVRGRDPKVEAVPVYLASPPSDLPPGVAGTLVDEKVDIEDIIATLIDLARRGVLIMREEEKAGFGSKKRTFTFEKVEDHGVTLADYEKELVRSVFGRRASVALDALQDKFYTAVPKIEDKIYDETVERGFFLKSPDAVRTRWRGLGGAALLASLGLGFLVLVVIPPAFGALACIFGGLAIASIALIAAGGAMPVKTRDGALEAAKWNAFKEYLRNIEKYTDIEQAGEAFEAYLAYAVAFGIEKPFIRKFAEIETTPIPAWYFPVRPFPAGRTATTGGGLGGSPGGGTGGLVGGVGGLSAGVVAMLGSSARTDACVPSSSGSTGGFSSGG